MRKDGATGSGGWRWGRRQETATVLQDELGDVELGAMTGELVVGASVRDEVGEMVAMTGVIGVVEEAFGAVGGSTGRTRTAGCSDD